MSPSILQEQAAASPATAPAPSPSVDAVAAGAIAQLDLLEASLSLDIVINPNDVDQMRALARVTSAALGIASDIVSADPSRFPDFAGLPEAAAYVRAMTPLLARATELVTHLQKSILNQRTAASLKTLALYTVAKGLGRMAENQTMRDKVLELRAEIAPPRPSTKPKVTKAEKAARRSAKAKAARVAKALAFLEASGHAGAKAEPPPARLFPSRST
jgi:hypothetical protein